MGEELTELRKVPVLRVLALMSEGKSAVEACSEVGISRATFYRTLEENPDLPKEVTDAHKEEMESRYEKVRRARWINADKIIESAGSAEMNFRDRLALDTKLSDLQTFLENQLGLVHETPKELPAPTLGNDGAIQVAKTLLPDDIKVRLRPGTGKISVTVTQDIERISDEIVEGEVRGEGEPETPQE
jgi:hypothetical protein